MAPNQEKTDRGSPRSRPERLKAVEEAASTTVLPSLWRKDFPDLVGGFGDRRSRCPASCVGATRQVHETRLVHVGSRRTETGDCDGLVVTGADIFVGIRTADCVPILMAAASGEGASRRRWAAAIHAGWRGTIAGIAAAAVEAAAADGIGRQELRVALGPAIQACCYEVGEDIAAPFERLGAVTRKAGKRPHLDLLAANLAILEAAGIHRDQVEQVGSCTRCHVDRYYSYRANSQETGRQWSWLGWVDPTHRTGP